MIRTTGTRGRILLALVAVVALASLSAGAAGAKRTDTITLNVLMQSTGTPPWDAVNANFEKANPNIQINMEYVPTATLPQLLLTQLQGGNGPDIFYGSSGSGNTNSLIPLVNQGYLADLSKQAWSSKIPKEFDSLDTLKGKRYLFPLDIPSVGIMYNPVLMKQNGFSVPNSFAQLLSLCKAAQAKGMSALTIAGAAGPNLQLTADALGAAYVYSKDPNWDAERAAGKVTFANSPLWTSALNHFVSMYQHGCYQQGAAGAGGNAARGLVANGQALGEVLTTAAQPQLLAVNPNVPLAMAAFPGDRPGAGYLWVGPSDSLAVNAHSPNLKAALTYIDFLARTGQSRLMAGLQGGFSWNDYKRLTQGKLTTKDFAKAGFAWASGIQTALNAGHGLTSGVYDWPNPNVATALDTDMQGLMTGQKSVAQTLSDMDAAWGS